MLTLHHVTKSYPLHGRMLPVLKGIDLTVTPGQKVAILGRNGAGKSTLIRLIGGLEKADSGDIQSYMSISWPLGYSGGMQGSLTGLDNIYFLSRIYGVNPSMVKDYVSDFTELGTFLLEPVKTYSAGMRGRLAFALSMAFDFDCLLIDEGLSAGDSRFTQRCRDALNQKKEKAIVMVSHSQASIKEFCDQAYVLHQGQLHPFASMDAAYQFYGNCH
ncbi:MAG: ATP-binding cassette domain-containing protein [Actinobacteria bacterium]|nr:ATP-binding cassette domain-containing protein [Actinomycetota bacterium]